MALLQETDPDIALLLIGDGQHRTELERQVTELGLRSVIFTGSAPYERMPDYLSACDAGVVLSAGSAAFHYSPVKLREYMACGLPVIAHAVGELEKTLDDGTDALLVAPGHAPSLAEAFRHLADDAGLRHALGSRGLQLAHNRWSWASQTRAVLDALRC
jgi:glycosyltransferase involved in cell wall biosynthesis